MKDIVMIQLALSHHERKLQEAVNLRGTPVSAGEYAKHCGVSRSTAKERLSRLVAKKRATLVQGLHTNKSIASYYMPYCQHEFSEMFDTVTKEKSVVCVKCGATHA